MVRIESGTANGEERTREPREAGSAPRTFCDNGRPRGPSPRWKVMWVVAWLAAPMVARGATIACDQVKTCVQSGPESTCFYDIAATAPDVLHVTIESSGVSSAWRLRPTAGGADEGCAVLSDAATRDCPVTASGPYVLEVHTLEGIGTTAVHLQRLAAATACDSTIAGCDTLHTASLASEVDSDLFEFTVVEGERVRIAAARATGTLVPTWRLLDADGGPAGCASQDGATVDCGPLPGGHYQIEVGSAGGTGSASVYLQRLTRAQTCESVALVCDETPAVDHHFFLESDLLDFALDESGAVAIGVRTTKGSLVPAWRVLDVTGAPVSDCADVSTLSRRDCGILPAGAYRVEVGIRQGRRGSTCRCWVRGRVTPSRRVGSGLPGRFFPPSKRTCMPSTPWRGTCCASRSRKSRPRSRRDGGCCRRVACQPARAARSPRMALRTVAPCRRDDTASRLRRPRGREPTGCRSRR